MTIRANYHRVKFRVKQSTVIKDWIENVIREEGKAPGEINLFFTDSESVREINKEFLEHDYYTDVISFDYGDANIISGEIYISVETVKENAERYNEKPGMEMNRVILHGILHLLGYKDKTEEQKRQMRSKEDYYLTYIGE